jgi:hypothetical protein
MKRSRLSRRCGLVNRKMGNIVSVLWFAKIGRVGKCS